jgi:hypothetical protein
MFTINTFALAIMMNFAPTLPTQARGDTLDFEGLGRMLKDMDQDYRKFESKDKSVQCYIVKVTRDDSESGVLQVIVQLSPNRKKIWSHLYVAKLEDGQTESPAMMAMLLEKNSAIMPSHYRYEKESKMLIMSRCSDTRNLTPTLLGEHLDAIVEDYVQSENIEMILYGFTNR